MAKQEEDGAQGQRKTSKTSKASKKASKHVYFFGDGKADGNRTMKDLLGGKGAGLAEMTNAGLPVPPGFTIATDGLHALLRQQGQAPPALEDARCWRI